MTTTSGPTLGPQNQTHVKDMPPLVTTTTGIPAAEHAAEAPPTERKSRLNTWVAVALVGVLAVVIGAIAFVVTRPVTYSPSSLHMGLSDAAWTDYRAGERAVATSGFGGADWQSYRSGERASSYVQQPQLDRLTHYPVW